MSTDSQIATYRGKNVRDMSREELIDAVIFLGGAYNRLLESRAFERGLIEARKARFRA